MKIKVGISNRHIHLSKEDADILFGPGYEFKKRNDLSQKGEYATEDIVVVSTPNYTFDHVRVLMPLRPYTQVEVSTDDAVLLGITPPIRDSGDLANSESVYLETPRAKIYKKNCCIIPNRHLHCNKKSLPGYNNKDIVNVKFKDTIIDNVHIKMADNFENELHLDRSDGEHYNITNGDYVDLE